MKTIRNLLLPAAGLLLFSEAHGQSTYALVNLDTVTYYGTTDTLDYMPVQINTNGNVVIAGNQKMSSTQYNALTAAETSGAVNVWINSYNTSNQKAFVVASAHDNSGNIYTAGAVRVDTINGLDFLVIKYDAAGVQQWTYTYNGPNSTSDVASAICVDNIGNVFITGASEGNTSSLIDYATIALDPAGNFLWCSRYDYNGVFDIPVAIEWRTGAELVVTGSSGSTYTDWDYATIVYDPVNGNQHFVTRTANPAGAGQDKVFSMAADSLGNVYVAGTTFNGNDYDVEVIKLDTSLTTVWTKTLDINGYDDAGINVALDDSLNLYVTGFASPTAVTRELFLFKFDKNGTFAWKAKFLNPPGCASEGLRVKVKTMNEIFVGGNIVENGNQDIMLLRFNKDGQLTMAETYNGPANGKDYLMDLETEADNIFVSARSFNGTDDDNILIHYKYREREFIPVMNPSTGHTFASQQVLVNFHRNALNMGQINNTNILFGKLADFVHDSTCARITAALDPDSVLRIDARTFDTQKVFYEMTEADSITIARTGESVRVPAFYCELLIDLPATLNPEAAAGTIMSVKPDVDFAQLNYLYEPSWVPNDTLYVSQTSLHASTQYPNAHINCEPAWDYTKGESFVRAGVYDTGVNKYHMDLAGAISKEKGYTGSSVPTQDAYGHGTQVAGIMGARSNNTIGVAGIAGGNGQAGNGVSLYNVKIYEPPGLPATSVLQAAYKEGADGTAFATSPLSQNHGLHLMNHSYGSKNLKFDPALMLGINYCNRLGVAFIASRGNHWPSATHSITAFSSPATLREYKVMNVGASGTDGHYHKLGVNGAVFNSMYGRSVDFVAPGDTTNVLTTSALTSTLIPWKTTANASYTRFGGTSASAPHVSGVVALMMSYRNQSTPAWDNIVHEDCEYLLKMSSTDLASGTYTESAGPDLVTGHGRINADSALGCLQPQFKIRHIDPNHHSTGRTVSTSTIASNVLRYWPGSGLLSARHYWTDIIKITTQYSYPFGNEEFIAAWPLYKNSDGVPNPAPSDTLVNYEESYVEVVAATNTNATLTTYAYRIISPQSNPNFVYNLTIPWPYPVDYFSAFTLYTKDTAIVTSEMEKNEPVGFFNVYPNPSAGEFTVAFSSKAQTQGCIAIFDIMGKKVHEMPAVSLAPGLNRITVTATHLKRGIHFLSLDVAQNRKLVKKLIIE